MRKCKRCGYEGPDETFTKNKLAKSGYGVTCLSCERLRGQRKRRNDPLHAREAQLRYNYGITNQVYLDLALGQGNRCKLCARESVSESLHVDHCHKTGIVRGLLCRPCNTALGMLQEDVEVLKRAIAYLGSYARTAEVTSKT